ncbi:MAG: M20 family metallopeptidase [Steroidobacteraceae bacterium]
MTAPGYEYFTTQISRCHVRFALVVLVCALTASPVMAAMSGQERKAVAAIDVQQPWAIDFLEQLVNVNSGTYNLPGVMRVGVLLRPQFESLGFTVVWKPMEATARSGHLIATHQGRSGAKRLLLIGHMDTVFELDSPFQKFVRKGDSAIGPGASDDKGGVVVMLAALRAMHTAGALRDANIEVVLTGDEEDAGLPLNIARGDLVAAGKRADVALDFEGLVVLDGHDMGSIARRSVGSYVITTHGVAAHSSKIFSPGVGDGAIFELARIISALRAELPEPNLTFNIGVIAGGASAAFNADATGASATGKTNITPSIAMANGDFRALTEEQDERVRKRMQAIVARCAPKTTAEIVFGEIYPPMAPTAGNRALLAQLNGVNADLGLPQMPELDPLMRGAGDISFVAHDVDALAGLGTVSSGDHTSAETVDLASIDRQGKRAALLMTRLSRESMNAGSRPVANPNNKAVVQ